MSQVDIIAGYGIPVKNATAVGIVNHLRSKDISNAEYKRRINELVGETSYIPSKLLASAYRYLITDIITNKEVNFSDILVRSEKLMKRYATSDVKVTTATKVTSTGKTVQVNKVRNKTDKTAPSKQQMAIAVYLANGANNTARKDMIKLFMSQAKLTKEGAKTYHYNITKMKKEGQI